MTMNLKKFKKLLLSSPSDPDFRDVRVDDKRKSHCLNKFINQKLQPDQQFHSLMSQALDDLCRHLQNNFDYSVDRLIKGGSLGKGTALKGKSDLDCVLILNDIKDVEELRDSIDEIRNNLIQCLEMSQGSYLSGWTIRDVHQTRFSVQFTMQMSSWPQKSVEVDLLPTFDIRKFELKSIYREMRRSDESTLMYYSAALTELQRDFVKELPPRVKDLIRLVKYWCKTFVKQNSLDRVPSSYLLELITIHAWEKVNKPTTLNMAISFKAVMEELVNYSRLDVVWHRYYQNNQEIDGGQLPRVLDPANPSNNLCENVNCWDRVEEVARETMQKPLFQDVTITGHWCRGSPNHPGRRQRRREQMFHTFEILHL